VNERDNAGGGGLTGATGDLTFEDDDRPFVTGEAREVSGEGADPQAPPVERDGETRIGGDELAEREERL